MGFLYLDKRVVYSIFVNSAASWEDEVSSVIEMASKSRESKNSHSSSGDIRQFFMSCSNASKHCTSIRTASL